MPHIIDSATFLELRDQGMPLFDARSPSEFAHGHIPHAQNLPVLNDEERAAVGTMHARSGSEAAIHLGLELIGPQLATKLATARRLAQGSKEVAIHCWRGGGRSHSLAWLLETGGFTVHLLEGGYKAYRQYVRASFAKPMNVFVLGGMTGSGKTDILLELAKQGQQVIDLEGIACHRGSAFGSIGMAPQPNNETFEAQLFEEWRALDPNLPVWFEDESNRIGTVALCDEFHSRVRCGNLVTVSLPQDLRIERLVTMYTEANDTLGLLHGLDRIAKRLGGTTHKVCHEAIEHGDFATATRHLLHYYDKGYTYQLNRVERHPVGHLDLAEDNPVQTAKSLIHLLSTIATS